MSGPKPIYPISLTEAEVKSLREVARAHKTGQSMVVRARILLYANKNPEWSNQQIAQALATTDRNVRKWRARWVATHCIADAPRSGAPRRFSPCSACASDSDSLQSATTERCATSTLESSRGSTTGSNDDERAKPFQQNRRTVVEGRADPPLALSSVATSSRS